MSDASSPQDPPHGVHEPHVFDAVYAADRPPAWDIGRPQPAFERLARAGKVLGRVLDVGCGTGEHALMAAALGCDAVGIDISERAIELAKAKGSERHVTARFVAGDALALAELDERFDTVLDCGLFHVLADNDRPRYVTSLAEAVPSGGHLHILCFSDRQPGEWGPRRVSKEEIRAVLSPVWEIEAIEPAVIDLTWNPAGAAAWLVAATRQ